MKVVSTGKIVIYTGNAGNPASEFRAPNNGVQSYNIPVNEITAGLTILQTWWVPYDNIGDLLHFSQIAVTPAGAMVALSIGAYAADDHRMRIMLYVLTD